MFLRVGNDIYDIVVTDCTMSLKVNPRKELWSFEVIAFHFASFIVYSESFFSVRFFLMLLYILGDDF